MYQIIQKRKIWLTLSSIVVALSIVALSTWGLKFGIDFTGGSLLEVEFEETRPSVVEVNSAITDLPLGGFVVQPVGEKGMIVRFQNIEEQVHQDVLNKLKEMVDVPVDTTDIVSSTTAEVIVEDVDKSSVVELRYDSVGPTIGEELKSKSLQAMIIVLIAIIIFIAWAFQKVSKPVESWKYGLTAIFALFHDVIITMGVFAVLGEFYGLEVNTPFVAAILTVLGYSVNDTIVVFDRIRENLPKSDTDFEDAVNTSVNQTIKRSINTSLTTFVVLISIVLWGGETIRGFVLALSIGVLIGTYSSIFLASPLLVIWEKIKK
jgi:preprotein translocase subunit SecF